MLVIKRYLNSSIGLQQVFVLTGLLLIASVFLYLGKDLLIYFGPGIYNNFHQELLSSGPGKKWGLPLFIFILFLIHLRYFFRIAQVNKTVRPFSYRVYRRRKNTDRLPSIYILGAFFIMTFVVWHLLNFEAFLFLAPSTQRAFLWDYYSISVRSLAEPYCAGVYFYSLTILGILFIHHIRNFVQTFGIFFPPYSPEFNKGSFLVGLLLIIIYGFIPFFVLNFKPRL